MLSLFLHTASISYTVAALMCGDLAGRQWVNMGYHYGGKPMNRGAGAQLDEVRRSGPRGGSGVRIDKFSFGEVVIDGESYRRDLIVFPDRVQPGWWRQEGHVLQLEDLRDALSSQPEALIIGTGTQERLRVAPEVMAHTREVGIELLAFQTCMACRTFNELIGKRKVVALLHLTC
jgi:hypothetical protein